MAPPAILKARFFQRVSDNAWLARLDTSGPNPSMTVAEAAAHCAAEYGFAVRCVEADYPDPVQYEMVRAQRMMNTVKPPPQPAPAPDPNIALFDAGDVGQKLAILRRREFRL